MGFCRQAEDVHVSVAVNQFLSLYIKGLTGTEIDINVQNVLMFYNMMVIFKIKGFPHSKNSTFISWFIINK